MPASCSRCNTAAVARPCAGGLGCPLPSPHYTEHMHCPRALLYIRRYNVVAEPGSEEAKLVEVLQKPRQWV